jgi:glycolate oxidase iron-sulfur subunit
MRGVIEKRIELSPRVQEHLDLCLDCRGCETACPSGVQYGQIIEPFRAEIHRTHKAPPAPWWSKILMERLFPSRTLLWWSVQPAYFLQQWGIQSFLERIGIIKRLPPMLQQMMKLLPQNRLSTPPLPEFLPAQGTRRARVGLFLGCAADALYRDLNWKTARVLQANGCDVVIPRQQGCCGAISYHAGSAYKAEAQAMQNIETFGADPDLDAIVTNIAGCGAQMKEYEHLFEVTGKHTQRVAEFIAKVKDISEFLVELGLRPISTPMPLRIAYHPACHLQHAQKIKTQPITLLKSIPGVEIVPFAESDICCGAAGSYNLTEIEMSEKLGQRKVDNMIMSSADGIITGNIGCMMQMEHHLREKGSNMWVKHLVEILDDGYFGRVPESRLSHEKSEQEVH